jgi:tetratricopeptide (TPR) repeat protein
MNIPDTIRPLSSTSIPLPPDRDWHLDILLGNAAMAQGHLPDAEQAYLRSIERADSLLTFAHQQLNNTQLDIIHLYVISCTNLGNLYQQWQQGDRAEAILRQGHQRTIDILNAVELPVAFRWQAMLALRELMMQISSFYPDLERLDRTQALFEQTNICIQNFLNYLKETQL